MSFRGMCFLALLGAATAIDAAASSGTPVERVVKLLEELRGKLIQLGKENQRLYDKYACWCERTSKRKAAAIEEAQMMLRSLGQQILKYKGLIATRKAEIAELKKQIAEIEEAIKELTAVREKENAQFIAESTEMMQALAALEKAIIVLRDATKLSLLQGAAGNGAAWHKAVSGVKAAVAAMPNSAVLSPPREATITAFLQGASKVSSAGSYAPQSATVQGILKDMYDTFAADLEGLTKDEAAKNRQFEDIVFVKTQMKMELQEEQSKKEKELAAAEDSLAETQVIFDETEAHMKADIEFFDMTKEACLTKHDEWNVRLAQGEEEFKGIEEALKILTSDDARELFAKAIKPGMEPTFLQVVSVNSKSQAAVTRAYLTLKMQATKSHSLRLASAAAAVRAADVGHFDKVIKMIDEMLQVLKDEEAADIAKRDECKAEYTKVASEIAQYEWEIEKNLAKIHKLEDLIKKREDEKMETLERIDLTEKEIAEMEDQRKAENQAFLEAKSDDEGAIELLEAAKKVLMKYYKENKIELGKVQTSVKGLDLAQEPDFQVSVDQAPDATFAHKGVLKHETKGIVSIMTMIIEDLQAEIVTGVKDEAASQAAFEKALAAAKKLVKELEEHVDDLNGIIATRKEEWSQEHELMAENKDSLSSVNKYKKDITPDCDWILAAFEERRMKRKAESDALTEAKEYLAGAAPPAMLQTRERAASAKTASGALDAAFSNIGDSFLRR